MRTLSQKYSADQSSSERGEGVRGVALPAEDPPAV